MCTEESFDTTFNMDYWGRGIHPPPPSLQYQNNAGPQRVKGIVHLIFIFCCPVCPRSSDPFYIVSYYVKCVTTSWSYSISSNRCECMKVVICPNMIQVFTKYEKGSHLKNKFLVSMLGSGLNTKIRILYPWQPLIFVIYLKSLLKKTYFNMFGSGSNRNSGKKCTKKR